MKFRVKLKSLARKREKYPGPKIDDGPMYPYLTLDNKEMEDVVGLKHGDRVKLMFNAKVSDKSSHEHNGNVSHNATFRLEHGAVMAGEKEEEREEKRRPAPKNTTEAVDAGSKMSGGLGRIIGDFNSMAVAKVP